MLLVRAACSSSGFKENTLTNEIFGTLNFALYFRNSVLVNSHIPYSIITTKYDTIFFFKMDTVQLSATFLYRVIYA